MFKQGKGQVTFFIGLGIVALIIVGVVIWGVPKVQEITVSDVPVTGGDDIELFRANNPSVNLEARVEDDLAKGINGLNATLVIIDLTNGGITQHAIDTADASTTRDTFTDVITAGAEVEIGIITTQDKINSNKDSFKIYKPTKAQAVSAGLEGRQHTLQDPVKYDGGSSKYSALRCRGKDLGEDAFVHNGTPDKAQTTSFVAIAGTSANFSSSTTNTSKDIDASNTLNYRLDCKTVNTDSQFGENTGMWVDYLDTDSTADDFAEATTKFNGATLSRAETTVPSQDILANNGYEAFYNFGKGIGESEENIGFEISPESGEDPDNSILLRLVGSGIDVDENNKDALIGRTQFVAYNTDTSRTQLATATNNDIRLAITED